MVYPLCVCVYIHVYVYTYMYKKNGHISIFCSQNQKPYQQYGSQKLLIRVCVPYRVMGIHGCPFGWQKLK